MARYAIIPIGNNHVSQITSYNLGTTIGDDVLDRAEQVEPNLIEDTSQADQTFSRRDDIQRDVSGRAEQKNSQRDGTCQPEHEDRADQMMPGGPCHHYGVGAPLKQINKATRSGATTLLFLIVLGCIIFLRSSSI